MMRIVVLLFLAVLFTGFVVTAILAGTSGEWVWWILVVLTGLLVLLGIRTWRNAGFVEVPYGDRSPRGVTVTSLAVSISPGSILIDADDERRVIIFNVIDASDPEAFRKDLDRFYDRFQRHALP